MDREPDLELHSRSVEAEIREGFPPDNDLSSPGQHDEEADSAQSESYILDGQQRVTSIARVFLNADREKLYYFDLRKLYEAHSSEDDPSWIRQRARGKADHAPHRKEKNRLLRADIALNQQQSSTYVSEYFDDSDDFPDFKVDRAGAREATAKINGIFETIRNYKVPVVSLDAHQGVESICRVFETINSTGTRLRTFDLAVARFFPNPDLRKLWEDTLDSKPTLREFDVDGERVLQVLSLVVAAQEGRYPEPSRKNLLGLDPEIIKEKWEDSADVLAEAYRWAESQGAKPDALPSEIVLVAMAAVQGFVRANDAGAEFRWPDEVFMRRWYFSKAIQGGAARASNYRIGQDFIALRAWLEAGEQPPCEEVTLNEDLLLRLKQSDVRYKSLLNLLGITVREDMITGQRLDGASVHDHHIYPRNASKTRGLDLARLDSICNRIPILAETNQRVGEGYPEEYFDELASSARRNGTQDGLRRRLSDCLIPGDPTEAGWASRFDCDGFERFCLDRAALIVARVREVVGQSLKSDLSEDEVAEQASD